MELGFEPPLIPELLTPKSLHYDPYSPGRWVSQPTPQVRETEVKSLAQRKGDSKNRSSLIIRVRPPRLGHLPQLD